MKFLKKAAAVFAAVSMLASVSYAVSAEAGTGEYHDAYSAISSGDYEHSSKTTIKFSEGAPNGFMAAAGEYVSYLVDFGTRSANTLIMNMRPNLNNTQGSFAVCIDDLNSEPAVVFDHGKNIPYAGYISYAGPGYSDYCFNLPETLTGKHTVYFKALSAASTGFTDFYFTDSTVSAGEQIKPYNYSHVDTSGVKTTLTWGNNSSSFRESDAGETNVVADAQGALFIPGVNFGDGTGDAYVGANIRMQHWSATPEGNGDYEIRLDSINGDPIGSLTLTEAVSAYNTYTIVFDRSVTGVHTLVLCLPIKTNVSYIECFTAPSAYKTYTTSIDNAFMSTESELSYVLDFGETTPGYIALNVRPALEEAADGGIIDMYIDGGETPAASFAVYRSEVNMNTDDNEWFAPLSLEDGFTGVHNVTFKARTNARSTFKYFRFDPAAEAKDAYSDINAVDLFYKVHKGNSMIPNTEGTSFVASFGYWSDPYYSAAYTNVDFGENSSDKAILRVNNLDTSSDGAGKMEIRLDSRYGEVVGTLSSADMTYNNVAYYEVPLSKEISGVHDIVITSDFQTNFYSFKFVRTEEAPGASVKIDSSAALDDTVGVKSVVAKDDGAVLSGYGTSFIPTALFETEDADAVLVKYDGDIENGKSYSALLSGIPEAYRSYKVLARSFVELNGKYIWSESAEAAPAAAAE